MKGYYVETPSLTKEDAAIAAQMLNTVTMRLDQSPRGLQIIGSLLRIATGQDIVTAVHTNLENSESTELKT